MFRAKIKPGDRVRLWASWDSSPDVSFNFGTVFTVDSIAGKHLIVNWGDNDIFGASIPRKWFTKVRKRNV